MKKRIMAMLLVMLMIVTSLPSEMVFATTTESKFTYELDGSNATITGYTDTTVTSLVIPETVDGYTVVAIAKDAFSWDKYSNLTDLTVRGASVIINDTICGFDSDGSRNDNIVLWGTKNSTIETYAKANLFTFKLVTTSMTNIDTEADITSCYTNGGAFRVFTYLSVEGEDAAEDIIWESEDPEQVTVTAFGTPTKQDDGTYKAEATVRVLTKGDGTCKLYASARGMTEKKEIELTIKQSATSIAIEAAIYKGVYENGEVVDYELYDAPSTFYQNNLITADKGKFLWISPSVVGSDDDSVEGWIAGGSEKYMRYEGLYNNGWLFELKESTEDGYTFITVTSESLVCSKTLNVKITMPATGITMSYNDEEIIIQDKGNVLLIEGEKISLLATLTPDKSTDTVTWTSANSNVATVAEDGTLTAHNSGTSLITCKVKDCDGAKRDLQVTFTLSVYKKELYSRLGISDKVGGNAITELDIEAGTQCTVYPIELDSVDYTPNEPLIWTSSNPKVATVDRDGKITAADGVTGTTVISASASRSDSTNATASIVVNTYVKATSITLSDAQIPQGQSKVMSYTISPSTASEEIIWTPEDSSVVTVEDNGDGTITVTAHKVGNTTIEGRGKFGGATVSAHIVVVTPIHMQTLDIVVKDANSYRKTYIDDENITVYEVPKGDNIVLIPSYTPGDSNDGLKWWYDADGEKIASGTVNAAGNYEISAKAVGTQLFTLRSTNGLVAKCKIKVVIPAKEVVIRNGTSTSDIARLTVHLNESKQVNAYMGSNVTDICTWTANNDNIQFSSTTSANKEAIFIKGVKPGTTIVTVTTEDGYTDTLEVIVDIPVSSIEFVESGKVLTSGLKILLDDTKSITLNILPEDTTVQTFTWTSTYGKVRIVPSEDGRSATVTGDVVGTDTIKVTPDGGKAVSLSVNVMQPTEKIGFTCEHTTINKGSTVTAEVDVEPLNANDGITYTVDNEGVVSLTPSSDGRTLSIKGIGVGDVTITATTGSGKTASISITVVTIEASNFDITGLESSGYTYTGKPIEPTKLVVKYNGTTLKKDTDYSLSYENNTDVTDSARVIVTGLGKYSGTKEAIFTIKAKDASSSAFKVYYVENNLSTMTKTYDGKPYTPEIKIVFDSMILERGVDYDVEYSNDPVNVGKHSIFITYKGNFTGTKTVTYSIAAKSMTDSTISVIGVNASGYTYTGEAIKPDIIIKDGNIELESDTDYTLTYSGNINASTTTVKGKIAITGKGNYTGKKYVEFVIKPASISSAQVEAIQDKIYTGMEQKPSVKITLGDKTLFSSNYTLSYKSNVNTGKATIVITGKGNFTGVKNVYFKILPKKVEGVKQTNATKSTATLTWTKAVGGVTGYRIYQYNSVNQKYKYVGTTNKNKFTVKKLAAGSDFYYAVSAYKTIDGKKCEGLYSSTCLTKTSTAAPSITKAKPISSNTINLTLKKVKGATSYYVYVSTNGKKYTLKTKSGATSINISGLKSKKKYHFKIKAVRSINGKECASAFSKVKSVKTK